MIQILKSPKAECLNPDGTIDETKLINATMQHMESVLDGMLYFADKMQEVGEKHDYTKIEKFPDFKAALESGNIKTQSWYKYHITEERHHLLANSPDDINLIDVLEYITDCIVAGYARSDTLYDIKISKNLLNKAFDNTVEMLKKEIVLKEVKDE